MDRTAAMLGASVHEYSNYLYLSELFGKPTAIPLYEKFCGDVLSDEQLKALKRDIQETIGRGFWSLPCAPVGVRVERKNNKGETFDVRLRYIRLTENLKWIEQFKAAAISDQINASILIPQERQLELAKLHNYPAAVFQSFGNPNYVALILGDLKRYRKISMN